MADSASAITLTGETGPLGKEPKAFKEFLASSRAKLALLDDPKWYVDTNADREY